jgi:uncharacterized protein YndB with AHSA1/START domain
MAESKIQVIDPRLDLLLERVIDVPPARVWQAWTQPRHILKWFTPAPWQTVACEIDLRPGGIFSSTMRSPEGEEFINTGCLLEVVENRRLTFTNALLPGFRPADFSPNGLTFTAIVTMEPEGVGTRYSALALHNDEATRAKHDAMGFEAGWGKALDQLVELMKLR